MKEIMSHKSVHERIALLLKLNLGKPVPSRLLEFVANARGDQGEWHKRLRDLRYPVIGMNIKVGKRKSPSGIMESTYTLLEWRDLPPNHKQLIREWEKRNKRSANRKDS